VNAGAERESIDDDLTLSDVEVRTYLATSYSAEVEAERFYSKAAESADNPETKRLLSQFAQDEKGHQGSLTSAHRARFGGPPVYQPSDLPLPEQIRDDTTPLEALRIALAAEQKAQSYYGEAEQSMGDPELKELFGGLVAFERSHEERIKKRIKELGD
jgi:rubrerythrin